MGLKKNTKQFGVSLATLGEKNTASEGMNRTVVCISYEYMNINYEFIRKMYFMIESICDLINFLFTENESKGHQHSSHKISFVGTYAVTFFYYISSDAKVLKMIASDNWPFSMGPLPRCNF